MGATRPEDEPVLQLTKRLDYALIALTHLAVHPEERVSARELAELYSMPITLLANVLKALARGGVLASTRGTKGGYQLAEAPAALPVGRIVELIEGPLRLAECIGHDHEDAGCCVSDTCPVKRSVFKLHVRIRDVLYGMTVAELASGARQPGEALPVAHSEVADCLSER
ncbi:MAG: Rrf2 family transcriptional regulator [Planctomycetota bacterium]